MRWDRNRYDSGVFVIDETTQDFIGYTFMAGYSVITGCVICGLLGLPFILIPIIGPVVFFGAMRFHEYLIKPMMLVIMALIAPGAIVMTFFNWLQRKK